MDPISLNSVASVKATQESGVFVLECNITDINGETFDCEYVSRESDTFGLAPTVRQWLVENPSFPVTPYVPPTTEEVRAAMPSLTARQLRLGLLNAGISPSTVTATIGGMPAGPEKDKAQIEWEYATTFNRTHPLIANVGGALGLTDNEIDGMWLGAINL